MDTGIKVYEAMTNKPVLASSTDTVEKCAKRMKKFGVGSLLVTVGGQVRGLVTEKDLIYKVMSKGLYASEILAGDVMETDLITVPPEVDIFNALRIMRDNEVRRLPVSPDDGESITGFLTQKDILKIQPQLFELFVDKLVLREENHKPISSSSQFNDGLCESCGNWSNRLQLVGGSHLCPDCR